MRRERIGIACFHSFNRGDEAKKRQHYNIQAIKYRTKEKASHRNHTAMNKMISGEQFFNYSHSSRI